MEHEAAQVETTTDLSPVTAAPGLATPGGSGGGSNSHRRAHRLQRTAGNRIAAATVRRSTASADPAAVAGGRTQVGLEGGAVGADFEQGLQSARGSGSPIEASVRRSLEGAMGADLSAVRLHTGSQSAELNEQISAKAFTVGTDIFFREGVPDASTTSGQHLLAHEVAHTVQQTGGAQRRVIRRDLTKMKKLSEVDADTTTRKTRAVVAPEEEAVGAGVTAAIDGFSSAAIVSGENQYRSDMEKRGGGPAGAMPGADAANEIDVAAGSGESVLAFFNVYKAYKLITDPSNDEKWLARIEMAQAVSSVGAGAAKLTDKSSSLDKGGESVGKASEASSGLAGITDAFGGVKAAFTATAGLIELMNNSKEYSTVEQREMAFDVLRNAVEAARSAVSSARNFLDMAGSTVTASMIQTVPGLGLALSAADVAVRIYDIAAARVQSANMQSRAAKLQKDVNALEANAARTPADNEKLKQLKNEVATATSLEYINDKRQNRSYLKLGIAATRIAGDIATLGGASAPVGIGIKVAALAIDVGASMFRKAKQWIRDKRTDASVAPSSAKGTKLTSAQKLTEYNRMIDNVLDIVKETFSGPGATTPIDPAKAEAADPKYDDSLLPVATDYFDAIGYSVDHMARDIKKDSTGAKVRESMLAALRERE